MSGSETPGPNEMRDPLVRAEIKRAGVWIGIIVALALAYVLAQPLLMILAAFVVATMFDGGARLLGRVLPIGRGWRLTIILLAVVGFLGWTAYYAGSTLVEQVTQLQQVVVTQVARLQALAAARGIDTGQFDPQQLVSYALGSVGRVTAALGTAVGAVGTLFLIFVLAIYIAIEPRIYERGVAWFLPLGERAHFYDVAEGMGFTLRRLMAGRLLGMVIEGIATWILLGIYGFPMAALIGIITGLLVFIPNVGAIVSGVLMVLVGFSMGVDAGIYALIVYVVVQTVDGNIIVPMVAKRTVDLAPALVLGAQLLLGALFGILGLALADPIVAMIKVFLEKRAKRDSVAAVAEGPAEPVPASSTKRTVTRAPRRPRRS